MYRERLTVPLRWWALATMFFASVLIAFLVATPLALAVAVTVVVAALTIAVFVAYGRAEIRVERDTLSVGTAVIDVRYLGAPRALDAESTRRVLGVDADARAFLLVRPYLSESVLIPIDDPADPAPYWVAMTRNSAGLASAIAEAISLSRP